MYDTVQYRVTNTCVITIRQLHPFSPHPPNQGGFQAVANAFREVKLHQFIQGAHLASRTIRY